MCHARIGSSSGIPIVITQHTAETLSARLGAHRLQACVCRRDARSRHGPTVAAVPTRHQRSPTTLSHSRIRWRPGAGQRLACAHQATARARRAARRASRRGAPTFLAVRKAEDRRTGRAPYCVARPVHEFVTDRKGSAAKARGSTHAPSDWSALDSANPKNAGERDSTTSPPT
jgi:hypothetical protein